jgi:N-glycosylase/DNA lyase
MNMIKIVAPDFDLEKTLDSGQVFHWKKTNKGFFGTIGQLAVRVEQSGNSLKVRCGPIPLSTSKRHALPGVVARYFALDHPLAAICASFPDDPVINAARESCRGLRIIRQPKWECLATFICSSMKQVAHIGQISQKLRERFGEQRKIRLRHALHETYDGSSGRLLNVNKSRRSQLDYAVYTFPPADRIASLRERALRGCALGYRAKNLLATARIVASGEAKLEDWSALCDADLRSKLCELPGVGAKVANCVMLFAYERLRAFPIDVWIERTLKEKYFPHARHLSALRLQTFAEKYFGEHGGYAQQYLFHHARTNHGRSVRCTDRAAALRRPYPGMTKSHG